MLIFQGVMDKWLGFVFYGDALPDATLVNHYEKPPVGRIWLIVGMGWWFGFLASPKMKGIVTD